MNPTPAQAARLSSIEAYAAGLRKLPDLALQAEFRILRNLPEVREVLEAELARRGLRVDAARA